MDRLYQANVSVTAPPRVGVIGLPRDGGIGIPETIPGAWWFHMITEEIRAVITGALITPDSANLGQLFGAVNALIAAGLGGLVTVVSGMPGKVQINSTPPFMLQWFMHGNSADDETVTFPYAFATACRGVIPVIIGANASSSVNVQASAFTTTSFSLHAQAQERPSNVTGTLCIAFGN